MKIAFLGDLHLGIRNNSNFYLQKQISAINDVLIPHCRKNKVETLVFLGDFLDNRKSVNIITLQIAKNIILNLCSSFKNVYMILGNHDLYYRTDKSIDSISEIVTELNNTQNLFVIKESTLIEINKKKIHLVPWITDEKELDRIKTTKANVLCGHFDVVGATMTHGVQCSKGILPEDLSFFDYVFSGHFHTTSKINNIIYVGSVGQYTWSDYGDKKRFLVYDTKTEKIENVFFENDSYAKVYYNNNKVTKEDEIKNKIVKIIVKNKDSILDFEKFIVKIHEEQPEHIDIVEYNSDYDRIYTEDANFHEKDTITLFYEEIGNMYSGEKKKMLENIVFSLHNQALERLRQ